MTRLGEWLRASLRAAGLAAGISGCFLYFTPRAVGIWETALAVAATRACVAEGGEVLMADDHRVSCAPKLPSDSRAP
jgi:hypothetical protein